MKQQRWEESEKRREERRSENRKSQKKEDEGARKGRKAPKRCVFPMFCGSGGSKSRLAKAAGAEPSGEMRDEKLHAVVARREFGGQNAQSTSTSEHYWKKCARRCGARHTSKSKHAKHLSSRALLAAEMLKMSTALRPEADFDVKMLKTHHVRTTFGSGIK